MKAICSSETSVDFQRSTQRYIPEDWTLRESVSKLQQFKHTLLSDYRMLKIRVLWDVTPCSLVDLHQTKRRDIPVDSSLQSQLCENLKSHFRDPYSYNGGTR
jgi:hypothetical protein